ncbi:unnamed protein product [Trichobilharzia regenti]|nr:unnamed protein product [Trichobilharzia regenti]
MWYPVDDRKGDFNARFMAGWCGPAIFEQQKKRQQKSLEQNQPTAVVLGCIPTLNKINTTNIGSSGTTTNTTGTSGTPLETTETGTGSIPRNSTNQVTGVPKENGLVGK